MNKIFTINRQIKPFNKKITIEGDKSISIRWALLASQANGKSIAYNLLRSEDVMNTINCLRKLGIKIILTKSQCVIHGNGLNGYNYKKKLILDAGNSGTLGRLILGLLTHSSNKIKIIGDNSLSQRDFKRVTEPLKKFGVNFLMRSNTLPITIEGTKNPKPIRYFEKRGSAQCKSAVMFAALNTKGKTVIKAKKSRDHTELFFKSLKIPIKVTRKINYDVIEINGKKSFKPINYKIPSDISSSSFFIIITILSNNSKLIIKNVNINPSRTGILKILRLMNVKISFKNSKTYKGEKVADIVVKSQSKINAINCPSNLNSAAIDEFLLIFLVAAKANGVSYFKNLSELNEKESPRLKWGAKILNEIGIRNTVTKDSIKIYGNPNLKVTKKIIIKNFLKDHRVFMASVVAGLCFGGKWKIADKDAINTSFPTFLNKVKYISS